ncbi:hypothetical protein DVK06_11895 [Halorubrum sp. Atlit-28R]|nr:hypothetical protein DVK06_11895 [Halorubrum sp. Atlit-28R]
MSDARSTRVRSPRTETDDAATTDRAATADRAAVAERSPTGDGSRTANETGDRETCPECDGRTRVEDAERVCADCGLVVEADRIDHGPEWRSFDDEDTDPKRTGAPLIRPCSERLVTTPRGRAVLEFSPLDTGKYRTGKLGSVAA